MVTQTCLLCRATGTFLSLVMTNYLDSKIMMFFQASWGCFNKDKMLHVSLHAFKILASSTFLSQVVTKILCTVWVIGSFWLFQSSDMSAFQHSSNRIVMASSDPTQNNQFNQTRILQTPPHTKNLTFTDCKNPLFKETPVWQVCSIMIVLPIKVCQHLATFQ